MKSDSIGELIKIQICGRVGELGKTESPEEEWEWVCECGGTEVHELCYEVLLKMMVKVHQ
jgi:hypothetical protein